MAVNFPDVGKVLIERQTWVKVDRSRKIIGQRNQYPLVRSYASTCHKAQELTLPAWVVHCSQEFVSGLAYVAASRVGEARHLLLVQFRNDRLLSPPSEALSVCDMMSINLSCLTMNVSEINISLITSSVVRTPTVSTQMTKTLKCPQEGRMTGKFIF